MLFLLLACASVAPVDSAPVDLQSPTVLDCPAGITVAPLAPARHWSVASITVGDPGHEVAPWVQVWSDRVAVQCPSTGGVLTIEWGN